MATQEKTWNVANRLHSQKDSDNPEVDHIIAGADEIYDDEKGAKQSTINAQTDAALANRYTKDETYSKEQLDSLITTPDVEYVSVVATNATTSVTDILPATGEANTIYRVGNWNGSQYDPTMYALHAWNGTTYVYLAIRSFVGEVYDVSANHPDGQGNPTPYADLAAALGADGTNIPADIRRGGMRIQFIKGNTHSSDNVYVQYRYMGTAVTGSPNPFLNTANWQGVDDIPFGAYRCTAEFSENSVTISDFSLMDCKGNVQNFPNADGVYDISLSPSYLMLNKATGLVSVVHSNDNLSNSDAILIYKSNGVIQSGLLYEKYLLGQIKKNTENSLVPQEIIVSDWADNTGINHSDGSTQTAVTTKASAYIPISGAKIRYPRIKFTSSYGSFGIAFYSGMSVDTYLSGVNSLYAEQESGVVDSMVNVPEGAKYVRITYRMEEPTEFYLYDYIPVPEHIINIKDGLTDVKETVGNYESVERTIALDVDAWINNVYIYSSGIDIGNINVSSINSASDYVDLNGYAGKTLRYTRQKSTSQTGSSGMCFYDNNKQPISGVDTLWGEDENAYYLFDVQIPANARYARFTMRTEWLGEFSVSIYEANHKFFTNGLGFDVQDLSNRVDVSFEEIDKIKEQLNPKTTLTPVECRRRFYTEMSNWCVNHGIVGAIIEGPSGYGVGGEVEHEILGHGMSQVPTSGMGKVMAAALNYEQLNTIWQKDSYIINTKGVERTITFGRSLDSHYGSVIEQDYTILGWKTGSNGALTNLMVAVTNEDLDGNVLVGVMSRYYQSDTEENNRSLATKYLLDIGVALYKDRSADISTIEANMLAQHAASAIVFICPQYPAFMHKWDLLNDSYHKLYVYNQSRINTMSMIKVLVAQIVIDYVVDLDEPVTIIQDDINAATGGTGAIFLAGEQVTYRDLLCALLMPSSNQAGYALARKVGQKLIEKYGAYSFIPED